MDPEEAHIALVLGAFAGVAFIAFLIYAALIAG